jgi:hypothetical protein
MQFRRMPASLYLSNILLPSKGGQLKSLDLVLRDPDGVAGFWKRYS